MKLAYLAIPISIIFCGCSPIDINIYKDNQPKLIIEEFFNGNLQASGIVKNRKGEVIRYFNADIKATWTNNTGTLNEKFTFSDGEKQTRIWTLKKTKENVFTATANDVIGQSTLITSGNTLFLKYVLAVPYKESTINLSVDDKMYLLNDSTLLNESIMTKFGFEVAYLTLYIRKL